jgi:hypothetical protein
VELRVQLVRDFVHRRVSYWCSIMMKRKWKRKRRP